jgi:NodT family efflux transporter outer membrane factor (OMF) lipoprotein
VGPNYVPPKTAAPAAWHTPLQAGLTQGEIDLHSLATWWTSLKDPQLSSLMERAAAGNLDLKKAKARVREARARRTIARAGRLPTVDAGGSATWGRSGLLEHASRGSESYGANLDAGWELDFFGGTRRSIEAAQATLQSTEEDLHDVLVSLLAETALNYVDVRTFQARLASAESSLASQEETYQLTVWRCQAGLDDDLAIQQARYNLENTRSQMPSLRTGLEEAMNRIAVLLGDAPGGVQKELAKPAPLPVPPSTLAVGVPGEALRRRPDIRKAERQLAAQTAEVGVATADLYPKLTLNGSIGLETLSLVHASSSATWTASGGPALSWPLFRANLRANIEVQSALQEQYLVQYEATVLAALEEVENALVAYAQELQRRDSLEEATRAAQAAAGFARQKYQAGLIDFSTVLDAERSVLSFQDQLNQSSGTVTSNVIRLYKALGGGWDSTTVAPAAQGTTTVALKQGDH